MLLLEYSQSGFFMVGWKQESTRTGASSWRECENRSITVIGISHSGASTSTIQALALSRQLRARYSHHDVRTESTCRPGKATTYLVIVLIGGIFLVDECIRKGCAQQENGQESTVPSHGLSEYTRGVCGYKQASCALLESLSVTKVSDDESLTLLDL